MTECFCHCLKYTDTTVSSTQYPESEDRFLGVSTDTSFLVVDNNSRDAHGANHNVMDSVCYHCLG